MTERLNAWRPEAERIARLAYTGESYAQVVMEVLRLMERVEPQWQDIETAPKDGTRVLLFNPDEGGFGWAIQTGAYYEELDGWQYDGQNPRYSHAHPPTRWQPLPAPPGAAAAPPSGDVPDLSDAESDYWAHGRTGERQPEDLGPHQACRRCGGTGQADNAQFSCPCRWSTSPLRPRERQQETER